AASFAASLHSNRRFLDGRDDSRINSAAADVAVHDADNFVAAWLRVAAQQCEGRHQHPRSAIAALQCPRLQKCLLQRMKLVAGREALNGANWLAFGGAGLRRAGSRRLAVDQYSAGPAAALAATVFATGQVQIVAQYAEQAALSIGGDRVPHAV